MATLLIFIFGIFPVGFALFVSVHKWRLKRGDFLGLTNYVRGVGGLAYVGLFLLGLGAFIGAFLLLRRIRKQTLEHDDRPWLLAIPGLLYTISIVSFVRWTVLLLPEILDVANKIAGLERTQELFMRLLIESFSAESVVPAFQITLGIGALAVLVGYMASRLWRNPRNLVYQAQFALTWMAGVVSVMLIAFTYGEAGKAYQEGRRSSPSAPVLSCSSWPGSYGAARNLRRRIDLSGPGLWPRSLCLWAGGC
jgi:ABC-type sugar transport system permease subunit